MQNCFDRLIQVSLLALIIASPAFSQVTHNQIIILIDESGSMRSSDPEGLRAEGVRLLVHLLPDGDRISLVRFAEGISTDPNLVSVILNSSTRKQIYEYAAVCPAKGPYTDIAGALDYALGTFSESSSEERQAFRPGVVLLTDGKDDVPGQANRSQRIHDILLGLDRLQVPVYAVGLSDRADKELLKKIADSTGGSANFVIQTPDLLGGFFRVSRVLAQRWGFFEGTLQDWRPSVIPEWARQTLCFYRPFESGGKISKPAGSTAILLSKYFEIFSMGKSAEPPALSGDNGQLFIDVFGELNLHPSIPAVLPQGIPCLFRAKLSPSQQGELGKPAFLRTATVMARWEATGRIEPLYDDGMHDDGVAGDGIFGDWCFAASPGFQNVTISLTGPLTPGIRLSQKIQALPKGIHLEGPGFIRRFVTDPWQGETEVTVVNETDAVLQCRLAVEGGNLDDRENSSIKNRERRAYRIHSSGDADIQVTLSAANKLDPVDSIQFAIMPRWLASSSVLVVVLLLVGSFRFPRRRVQGFLMVNLSDEQDVVTETVQIANNGEVHAPQLPPPLQTLGNLKARSGLWRSGAIYEPPKDSSIQFQTRQPGKLAPGAYLLKGPATWILSRQGRNIRIQYSPKRKF